ncbi:MAG: Uma2 family endonuclease [Cyanobacteria bacterium SBLK]|nr:Uma2 family endonuclease [Cyanobacteria bacterium SBLK]
MVQTPVKLTFEEYLNYDDGTDILYELENGKLIAMTPPSPRHITIAHFLERQFWLEQIRLNSQWAVIFGAGIRTDIAKSRIPDLFVVEGNIWASIQNQSRAILENSPVLLAVEIVSPGRENRRRDYEDKVREYRDRGILEYWIVDPVENKITIFIWVDGEYREQIYRGDRAIASPTFPELSLTCDRILNPPLY